MLLPLGGGNMAAARDLAAGAAAIPVPTERVHMRAHMPFALHGFDPVAYFTEGGPQGGRASLEAVWNGAAWRFSSAANRAAFLSDPEAYAPRFGGYDADAMTSGRLVDPDPAIYLVTPDGLFLFRDQAARDRFFAKTGAVAEATRAWDTVSRTLAAR